MVMYRNATVYVASDSVKKNKEGTKIKFFDFGTPLEVLRADVQPNTLTTAEIQLYGLDEKKAGTKKMFFDGGYYLVRGNRCKVVFDDGRNEVYGIEPVPSRGGGSIPILADLQRILEIDPLLMGFGLERDTIHSPNESYLLKQLFAGMEAIALFYRYY